MDILILSVLPDIWDPKKGPVLLNYGIENAASETSIRRYYNGVNLPARKKFQQDRKMKMMSRKAL